MTIYGYEISYSERFKTRVRRLIILGELLLGVGSIFVCLFIVAIIAVSTFRGGGGAWILILACITGASFGIHWFILPGLPIWHPSLGLPFLFLTQARHRWFAKNVNPSLHEAEAWIFDTIVLDRDWEPLWLGITDERLLFLSYNDQKLTISRELDPVKITEIKEGEGSPPSGCAFAVTAGFFLIFFLLVKDNPGLVWFALLCAAGFILVFMWALPIREYRLKTSNGHGWEWSFTSRSIGSSAGELVSMLKKVMQMRRSWYS